MIPPGGIPFVRSVITEYNAPTHAPRFPSQNSGFGSMLKRIFEHFKLTFQ